MSAWFKFDTIAFPINRLVGIELRNDTTVCLELTEPERSIYRGYSTPALAKETFDKLLALVKSPPSTPS